MNDQTPYAVTMPPKHANFVKLSAQTHVTDYFLSPKQPDGFGEKLRAGIKSHWLWTKVYIDAYEFYAANEQLGVYEPEEETTVFGYSNADGLYFYRDMSVDDDTAFIMSAIKENAAVRFIAPRSGTFELNAILKREKPGRSTVNVIKNGVVESFTVTENETEVKFSAVLDANEEISLELLFDGSGDEVRAVRFSTAIKLLYTGKLDREYDNEGQIPIHTTAILCDIHLDGENPKKEFPP
jgi:hypothetical protein